MGLCKVRDQGQLSPQQGQVGISSPGAGWGSVHGQLGRGAIRRTGVLAELTQQDPCCLTRGMVGHGEPKRTWGAPPDSTILATLDEAGRTMEV